MKELRLTDAELQALIAPALRARLQESGFAFGRPMDARLDEFDIMLFPIGLDLAGLASVERDLEGVWTFRQIDSAVLHDRTADALRSHVAAIMGTQQVINRED